MNTIKKFLATDQQSWSLLIVRLALGFVLLPHGMQKALGMFGGYGFAGTVGFFQSMGMPFIIGTLVILAEFVGSIGVIIGLINSDSSYRDSQPIAYAFMGLVNGALIGWVFGYVIDQIKNSSTVQNISKKMEEDKVGNQKLADLQYSINKKNSNAN